LFSAPNVKLGGSKHGFWVDRIAAIFFQHRCQKI
jgi:hypothetical protein